MYTLSTHRPKTSLIIAELPSHWLNENFIVRLYAVMESHGLVGEKINIRKDLDGWEELDILRRLRNQTWTRLAWM